MSTHKDVRHSEAVITSSWCLWKATKRTVKNFPEEGAEFGKVIFKKSLYNKYYCLQEDCSHTALPSCLQPVVYNADGAVAL